MEGRTLVLSVLIMSLVMAQILVEAKSCCRNTRSRRIYNACRATGTSQEKCARRSGCKIVKNRPCPDGYNHDILENSGDAVNDFCKLGCEFSVCDALTTLQNSGNASELDASEVENGEVAQCTKACSNFCTNGQVNAVETA